MAHPVMLGSPDLPSGDDDDETELFPLPLTICRASTLNDLPRRSSQALRQRHSRALSLPVPESAAVPLTGLPPSSPFHTFEFEIERGHLRPRQSAFSRVSWDFFDPEGVSELRRAISSMTHGPRRRTLGQPTAPIEVELIVDGERPRPSFESSTYIVEDKGKAQAQPDEFDLETTLRSAMEQYVCSPVN